jgi:hypothetical protein
MAAGAHASSVALLGTMEKLAMRQLLPSHDEIEAGTPLRMLTRQQAATYCGVSVPTFMLVCPVSPVALGEGKRLERYDIRSLDAWLDKLGNDRASLNNDWLAKWDSEHDGRSRERS